MVRVGIALFVYGFVTLYRGAQAADASLDCPDPEERQALRAVARRRRGLGLLSMALGIGASLVPVALLRL